MVKIAIIETDQQYRDKLKVYFDKSDQVQCVLAVDSVEKFLKFYRPYLKIDVLLLNINLEGKSGIKGIRPIKKVATDLDIVMLTKEKDSDKVFQSISAGAIGYLLKSIPLFELKEAVISIKEDKTSPIDPQIARMLVSYFNNPRVTVAGETLSIDFSETELKIIQFIMDGLKYVEIPKLLGITLDGVSYHVKNIYKKLEVNSKAGIIKKIMNKNSDSHS